MKATRQPMPEEVLAILVDEQRHAANVDPEVDGDAVLTAESSIADWRFACDLIGWQRLGRVLNKAWGMNLPDSRWYTLLEPEDDRTLRGLCEEISRSARIASLPRAGLLGATCSPNRAFCAIRSILVSLGVRRRDVRPDSPVSPFLRRYKWKFLQPCIELAPGALPPVESKFFGCRIQFPGVDTLEDLATRIAESQNGEQSPGAYSSKAADGLTGNAQE